MLVPGKNAWDLGRLTVDNSYGSKAIYPKPVHYTHVIPFHACQREAHVTGERF